MERSHVIVDASSSGGADLLREAVRIFRRIDTEAKSFARSGSSVAFTAIADDEIVGWCWGYRLRRPDGTSMGYIHELEVAETHRRRGIGRDLLQTFANAVQVRGATKVFLTTGKTNIAARSLYDALGGRLAEQGETVNYWFALPLPDVAELSAWRP